MLVVVGDWQHCLCSDLSTFPIFSSLLIWVVFLGVDDQDFVFLFFDGDEDE